jgi:Pyridoxamine 5'-phosphate oxidase
VDAKPKTTRNLRRLRNIRGNPRVAVLADHYDEDWASLWWVRADGRAVIEDDPRRMARPIALLAARYRQHADNQPEGPVIDITVERWSGWAAAARLQAGDRGDHFAADDLERGYLPDPGHRADRRLELKSGICNPIFTRSPPRRACHRPARIWHRLQAGKVPCRPQEVNGSGSNLGPAFQWLCASTILTLISRYFRSLPAERRPR